MNHFHHRKLPNHSGLLSGHTPPDALGFQSSDLQIWYNNTNESWVKNQAEAPHKHLQSDEIFIVLQGWLVVDVGGGRKIYDRSARILLFSSWGFLCDC